MKTHNNNNNSYYILFISFCFHSCIFMMYYLCYRQVNFFTLDINDQPATLSRVQYLD